MASLTGLMTGMAQNYSSTIIELEKRLALQDKILSDILKAISDTHPELVLKYMSQLEGFKDGDGSIPSPNVG